MRNKAVTFTLPSHCAIVIFFSELVHYNFFIPANISPLKIYILICVRYAPNLLSRTILQQRSVLYGLDGVIVSYLQFQIPLD